MAEAEQFPHLLVIQYTFKEYWDIQWITKKPNKVIQKA